MVQSVEDRVRTRCGELGDAGLPGGDLFFGSVHSDAVGLVQVLLPVRYGDEDGRKLTWYLSTSCNQ